LIYPFFDPTIILLIPALIFSMWAQVRVKGTFAKYSEVDARKNVTADQVSRALLDQFGLQNIRVERIAGQLTDHYDPQAKVLRLSDAVAGNRSIAAIGVAAHEVGHAIQDKEDYTFLRVRNAIVPVVNIGSAASMPLFLVGLIMGWMNLLNIGILLFCGVLVFHLVTLPVEFDASARALKVLSQTGLLASDEIGGARAVLNAAALTYVAALVMTVLQLVRLLALRNMRRD
jgi:Zn-dependent membrane protease YugP